MTCREKLAKEKPEFIIPNRPGGCYGCPHLYGYLSKPSYCSKIFVYGAVLCKMCWDREIPEEGIDNK